MSFRITFRPNPRKRTSPNASWSSFQALARTHVPALLTCTTMAWVATFPPSTFASGDEPAQPPQPAKERPWWPWPPETLGSLVEVRLPSKKFFAASLHHGRLLWCPTEPAVVELPWPDGTFKRFRITRSPDLVPELNALWPQEYHGRGVDDESTTVRLYRASRRLHAVILSAEGTVLVNPRSPRHDRHAVHLAYFRRDYKPPRHCPCDMVAPGSPTPEVSEPGVSPEQSGHASLEEISIRRTYHGGECGYKFTLRRDGTAIRKFYESRDSLASTCNGVVATKDFAALATFIQDQGFFDFEDQLGGNGGAYHGPVVTTRAVVGDGQKRVRSTGHGPRELQAIENAIDALVEKVTWTGKHQ